MAKPKTTLDIKRGVQFQVEKTDPKTGEKSWGNVLTKGEGSWVTFTNPASGRTESGRLKGNEVFRLVCEEKKQAPPLVLAVSV